MLGDILCFSCKHCDFLDFDDEDGTAIATCDIPDGEPSQSWHKCDKYEEG